MDINSLNKKRTEAIALYEMKKYEQAEDAFKTVLAEEPDNYYCLHLLASCYLALKRYDEAEEVCMKNIPTYVGGSALIMLGIIYRVKRKYKSSEECFLKALEIDPQNPDALSEYAFLLLICGYNKKADEVMHEAEIIDPQNYNVLHYKYYFKHSYGSKKEEIEAVEQFITYTSDEVAKLIKIGQTEYKSKNYKKAKKLFIQAFTLEPTNKYILSTLEELDRLTHFVFIPKRLFAKYHPVIRFIVIPVLLFLLLVIITGLLTFIDYKLVHYFANMFFGTVLIFILWLLLSNKIYNLLFNKKN